MTSRVYLLVGLTPSEKESLYNEITMNREFNARALIYSDMKVVPDRKIEEVIFFASDEEFSMEEAQWQDFYHGLRNQERQGAPSLDTHCRDHMGHIREHGIVRHTQPEP